MNIKLEDIYFLIDIFLMNVMTGTFKEFYKFVKMNNSAICELWKDFNNRPDPQVGDEYVYINPTSQHGVESTFIIVFDKIIFDSKFDNGVAFYYIFHRKDNGDEIKIHTINDIYNLDKITFDVQNDIFRFWRDCIPFSNQ